MNITGKYLRVWKSEVKEKMVIADLGEGKKNKDGGFDNFTWFGVKFVGNCKEKAESLEKGDTVEIVNGLISQRKWEDKWFNDIVVFDFEVMTKGNGEVVSQTTNDFAVEDDDDLPY